MSEWRAETVEECLVRIPIAALRKLQTQDYRSSGRHPVIDQGQTLIAGWTDDDSGLIAQNLPVVVFGDHTRALKFVDFPFVRGADGTQVLKPKPGLNPLFFYYALRSINLPSRGYNRHFKALKESQIPVPTDSEQSDIARALKLVDDALSLQNEELRAWDLAKKTAMRELFTRGLKGEALKETEIGPMPENWRIEPISAHFSAMSGGTPSRGNPSYWNGGTIPWVKTTEVDYSVIWETEEHINEDGLNESAAKLLPVGTLLLAMYGQGITRGKVAIVGIEATCNQACAALTPLGGAILTKFLYHFLTYRYEDIRHLAHGGQQQNLNLDIVRSLPVAYPTEAAEQQQIVDVLDAVDRKIDLHTRKRAVLDELFKALLHKLMSGEIRVSDLDLIALTPRQAAEATV